MRKHDLSTRDQRKRLAKRSSPYWTRVAVGRGLGYRREPDSDVGYWFARLRVGGEDGSPYKWRALGEADDRPKIKADGKEILDYSQAFAAAMTFDPFKGIGGTDDSDDELPAEDAMTVAWSMGCYMRWFEIRKSSVAQTRNVIDGAINPQLGTLPIDRLTSGAVRQWHEGMAASAPRRRTANKRRGKRKQPQRAKLTDDQKRARKSTANRNLSVLKAALNQTFESLLLLEKTLTPEFRDRLVTAQAALRAAKPFDKVDGKRTGYLESDEAQRLANACDPDFRAIVMAALYTGCRWGELTRLRVADMRFPVGGVYVAVSKSGHPRTLYLNDDGIAFFEGMVAGRVGDELVFERADGRPWGGHQQARRMRAACEAATIKPRVVFHELRHTYASLYLMAGGGLVDLAKQLGHRSSRMVEQHYGHLAEPWRADRARKFAPSFGLKPTRKARRMSRKRKASAR
ncbi:MAG: site-specific integrase [Acidobacteria bacterium]|nr:site-specific integrase [Acidobacteriota bacterium]